LVQADDATLATRGGRQTLLQRLQLPLTMVIGAPSSAGRYWTSVSVPGFDPWIEFRPVAKRCPLCDFVADDDAAWRRHLRSKHDWDPSGEPTHVGDVLVAIGFGFVVFLALMMVSLCTTGPHGPGGCARLDLWLLAGLVSFVAGVLVVVFRPLEQLGWRRMDRERRRNRRPPRQTFERRGASATARIDAVASTAILAGVVVLLLGLSLGQEDTEQSTLRVMVICVALLFVGISAFVRARARKKILT
jgi:hypothetical protein